MQTLNRRRTNWWQSAFALALAGCVAIAGCGKRDEAKDEGAVPDVTVTRVERGVISQELTASGNLTSAPNRDAKLAAPVAGHIARVMVSEGDTVKEGQVLAQLESQSLLDQLHQAEAAESQNKANLENARLAAQREEGLLQRGIASRKEVEDARTQLAVNEAALRSGQAAVSVARTQLGRSLIRAPFAGTVVHRFLGVGEQVDGAGNTPVIEVANIDTFELLASVPASRLQDIRTGENFSFETKEAEGTKFIANVVAVLPAVDPATNNGTVRVRIENPKHLLKFGSYLTLSLPLKESGAQLTVPRQAVYPDENGEPHVYKVVGDQATAVAVQVGVQTKEKAQILSGVKDGDVVIVNGGYGLPEKSKVHVK